MCNSSSVPCEFLRDSYCKQCDKRHDPPDAEEEHGYDVQLGADYDAIFDTFQELYETTHANGVPLNLLLREALPSKVRGKKALQEWLDIGILILGTNKCIRLARIYHSS